LEGATSFSALMFTFQHRTNCQEHRTWKSVGAILSGRFCQPEVK
jgi:hypothetical protein